MRKADNLAGLTNLYYIITWEYSLRISLHYVHSYNSRNIQSNSHHTRPVLVEAAFIWQTEKRVACDLNWTVFLINNRLEHVLKKVIALKVNFLWDLVEKWRSLRKTLLMAWPACHGQYVHVCPHPSANLSRTRVLIQKFLKLFWYQERLPKIFLYIPSSDWSSRWIDHYDWLGQ